LVAAPHAENGSLTIHQDASIYLSRLGKGASVEHPIKAGRHAWLQVLRGGVSLNGQQLSAGDGAAVSAEPLLTLVASEPAEVMLFDLP
jgi:redox-sensitive bicupin YhaK (pirin superfamily)